MDRPIRDKAVYRFGVFRLDATRGALTRDGAPVALTPTVFDLLRHLVENAGRVVTKDELFEAVWPGRAVDESNLTTSIFVLRRALRGVGESDRLITTAPGRGYMFAGEVSQETGAPPADEAGPDPTPPRAPTAPAPATGERARGPGGTIVVLPCVLLAVGLVAVAWLATAHWPLGPARAPPSGVVLAPLQNLIGDPGVEATLAIAEDVDFSRSKGLSVLSDAQIGSILRLMTRPPGAVLTADLAHEVCLRANGRAVIDAEVSRVGPSYLLALRASDCAQGETLAAVEAQADGRGALVATLDRLARTLSRDLESRLASRPPDAAPLLAERTASLEALRAYSKAQPMIDRGQYLAAEALLDHAVALDPGFAMAHADLAFLRSMGVPEDSLARAHIKAAHALETDVGERDRLYIGALYDRIIIRDIDAEVNDLRRWTGAYPADPLPWTMLAYAQMSVSHYSEAIAAGRRALALGPDMAPGYFALAVVYLRAHDPAGLERVCQQAVAKGLADDEIHVLLLRAGLWRGDGPAIERERSFLKGRSAEASVYYMVGLDAFSRGRIAQGEAFFDRTDEIHDDPPARESDRSQVARWEAELGYSDRARERLRRLDGTDDVPFLVALAETGDTMRAETMLRAWLARSPHNTSLVESGAPQVRAIVALRQGRPRDAVAALRGASAITGRGPAVLYLRGQADLAAGDGAGAAAEFLSVLGPDGVTPLFPLYPQSDLAILGLARAYRLQGRLNDARRAYQAFLANWRDADRDAPPLLAAKAELAALPAR